MTTKKLIQQYATALADNRQMDASEIEALLTEFAEKLQEPASDDFESEWKRYCDSKGGGAVTISIKDVAKHFAQWQREEIYKKLFRISMSSNPMDYVKGVGELMDELKKQ